MFEDARTASGPALVAHAIALGLAPSGAIPRFPADSTHPDLLFYDDRARAWTLLEPHQDLAQARTLFFDRLPEYRPSPALEYHHYPSGHRRCSASGRTWQFSESSTPKGEALALLRVAVLTANYLAICASVEERA